MNAAHMRLGAPPARDGSASGLAASLRTLAFPLLTNLWPLLLFVSQKVFVVPALVLSGFGDRAYRRDLLVAALISFAAVLVYLLQYANNYDQAHLIGFLLFAWSMPLVNRAIRDDLDRLKRLLTYFTLFNAVMGFALLASDIDLYGLRGLNRVVGTDGLTHRVYFESASLSAVVLLQTFRSKWLRIAALLVMAAFVVLVARSVAVVMLLGLNLTLPYVLRSSAPVKVLAVAAAVLGSVLLYVYLPVLRPDVDLSLQVKQFQLDLIIGSLGNSLSGWGWGAFYPELASDPDQPYQIEMQLPMLLLQVGPVALLSIVALTFALFLSATTRPVFGSARFVIYLLIGFNNPWLFVPSWFLTCQLLFRYDDADR